MEKINKERKGEFKAMSVIQTTSNASDPEDQGRAVAAAESIPG